MKRPMETVGLTLALATWVAFFFPAGQALLLSAAAAATGLLLAVLRRGRLRVLCVVCFVAAGAFALHTLQETRRVQPFLRAQGQTVLVQGIVSEARLSATARTAQYTLQAQFPGRADLPPATLRLRAFGEMEFVAGDVIRCEAELSPAQRRPGELPVAAERRLEGVLRGEAQRLAGGYPVQRRLLALRERLRGNVYTHLRGQSADLVSAMVLGMQDNISPEVYAAVNRAGTVHLLSVSGLHLSVLTAAVLRLLAALRLPRRAQISSAVALALAFTVLVGFFASIVRSFLMTAIALLAQMGPRRSDSRSSLGFAVAVICVVWPDWVLGKGFWLSCGATLGILLFAARIETALYEALQSERVARKWYNRVVRVVCGALAVGLAAYTVTLPLLVAFNGWISLVSPLANLLVAPFVPVVMLGGIVCSLAFGAPVPVQLLAGATDLAVTAILQVSQRLGALPFATLPLDHAWMLAWLALLAGVAAVLLVFRAGRRLAAYAAALLVLVFAGGTLSQAVADRDVVELAVVADCDVAVLLRGGDAVLLGTPAWYEANRLLRYLEYRGVRRIRAVIASDCGEQVGSGLGRVCARYPVDCIIGPNDSYILGEIAAAVPQVPVYSGGYASLQVLGGAQIAVFPPRGDIVVRAGQNSILKSDAEYAIIHHRDFYTIGLFADGAVHLQGAGGWEPVPLGQMLFGELRFRLRV